MKRKKHDSFSILEYSKREMYLANACHVYTHVIRLQGAEEGKYISNKKAKKHNKMSCIERNGVVTLLLP